MESFYSVGKGGDGCLSKAQTRSPKEGEEMLLTVRRLKEEGSLEPKIENMISRITELLQVSLEEAQLKEVLSKKQETLRTLSLHCQEKEIEALRQQAMTKRCKKKITELSSKIQEERLKKRQQRMESSQQLEGMMEKHKRADTRSQKMSIISRYKEQLLKEERKSQEKPGSLRVQVGALIGPEAAGASGEDAFLHSAEAAAAMQLFEEENKKATEFLEAAALHYRQLQQKYQRMKRQLEALSGKRGSQERSPQGAAGGKSSVVTKAVMEIPKKD